MIVSSKSLLVVLQLIRQIPELEKEEIINLLHQMQDSEDTEEVQISSRMTVL